MKAIDMTCIEPLLEVPESKVARLARKVFDWRLVRGITEYAYYQEYALHLSDEVIANFDDAIQQSANFEEFCLK